MALERRRGGKSETLSLRLDPRTRFALEFVARLKGQSITTVVERAIRKEADDTRTVQTGGKLGKNWQDFWNVNDGVRSIRVAEDASTQPTYNEEEVLDFIKTQWGFFSHDHKLEELDAERLDILWPNIDDYIESWRHTKSRNRGFVPSLMRAALIDAGVLPPKIPFEVYEEGKVLERIDLAKNLKSDVTDDDIPF